MKEIKKSKESDSVFDLRKRQPILETRTSLLEQLRINQDNHTWHQFFKMYWSFIYNYALTFKLPPADAEDIVQEVMLTIFKRLPFFQYDRLKGRFLYWLKSITKSRVIDLLRRRQARIKEVPLIQTAPDADELQRELNSRDQPEYWLEEQQHRLLKIALKRVQSKLSPITWKVFYAAALTNQPPKKIAGDLHISINTVYVYKKRVLALLKKELLTLNIQSGDMP